MDIKLKLTRKENLAHYGVSSGSVVTLDMEKEYLPICVSSEIYENNSRTPLEAKKAQAVAARTYIAAHALRGTIIDDTATYQAFAFKDLSTIPNSAQAVSETEGQVLLCDGSLITAWYSNSNGGRTKTSQEAWGGVTKWTVSKDDPWDTAGRAKWGEAKASHSVGMSQIGAAYAASAGETYRTILAFYYPNTVLANGYGETTNPEDGGEIPMNDTNKTNTGLVTHARNFLGQPYWYGTCCYKCTASLLNSKKQQYPAHYTDSRTPRYQDDIRNGRLCADCIGLMKGYLWEKDGKIVYDKNTDVNTSGLYNRASLKGVISTLPEVPGLMVYKSGHVGVYEGGLSVIEAKGFASGCVRSKLSDTAWTHWIASPWISYAGYESLLTPTFAGPYTAVVNTKSSPLNIWSDSSKARSLLRVAKGDTVTVTGNASPIGWLQVEKSGVTGVADGQYLVAAEVPDVEDDAGDKDETTQPGGVTDVPAALYRAKVVNVKKGLNLRTSPALTTNTITLIPPGAVVDVLDDQAANGFAYVCYGDIYGYSTKSYLQKVDGAPDALFTVRAKGVTADMAARIAELVPGASVTEAG